VGWYRSCVGEEARKEDAGSGLGVALYQAERWEEAKAVFAALAAEHPESITYKGRLGTLAARRGDRVEAMRIAEELRTLDRPYQFGSHTFITTQPGVPSSRASSSRSPTRTLSTVANARRSTSGATPPDRKSIL